MVSMPRPHGLTAQDVDKPSDDVGQTGHGQLSAHVLVSSTALEPR